MQKTYLTLAVALTLITFAMACGMMDDPQRYDYEEATRTKFDIEGYALDTEGEPIVGAKIERGGHGAGWVETDMRGYYCLPNNNRGSDYTVTPILDPLAFEPEIRCYNNIDRDHKDQNFIGKLILRFYITGTIFNIYSDPIAGVVIDILHDGEHSVVSTDASGNYVIAGIVEGTDVCLTPIKPGYTFEPTDRCYEDLDKSYPGQDFLAVQGEFDIDGYVLDNQGSPVAGIAITLEAQHSSGSTTTDANGHYLLESIPGGLDYSVIPGKQGCTFEPTRRYYPKLESDHTDQDFTATCP
jgi:hypothetical protein